MKLEESAAEVEDLERELESASGLEAFGLAALGAAVPALSGDAGVLALLDPDGRELVVAASVGYPIEACMGPGRRWPVASSIPVAEAVRTGQPVRIGSPAEWAERYEMGYVPQSRSSAWAAIPVRLENRPVGALLWTYYQPRTFSDQDLQVMQRYADAVANGVGRFLG